jgi:hypothetical protein
LPVRDRLDLFIHLCEGIQHAHQKGIIHRDSLRSWTEPMFQRSRRLPVRLRSGTSLRADNVSV